MNMKLQFSTSIKRNIMQSIRHLWGSAWEIRSSLNINKISEESFVEIKRSTGYKEMFFVIGTGRSGTQFLTNLINCSTSVRAYHEPNRFEDRNVIANCRLNHFESYKYIENFRKNAILSRIKQNPGLIYGEISGTLRYHITSLKSIFPHAKIFVLVRDGRDVVRSIMRFDFYKNFSVSAKNIKPNENDILRSNWDKLTRFEKVCWLWADSYNIMLSNSISYEKILKFENIISDYDYFNERLLSVLGISIKKSDWDTQRIRKSPNATNKYAFPHWSKWSIEHWDIFNKHCSKVMEVLGYY